MKQFKIGLSMIALVAGLASSSFKTVEASKTTQYNWFSPTGSFIQFSSSDPAECDNLGNIACASGYINTVEDPTQPAGEPDRKVTKSHN